MTRVLHTADTHIGYRQYHRDERRLDFLAAFERVVEDAIEADVDAVVHAGDLFHDKRPDLRDLLGVVSALRRLRRADVPFLGVVGNHERKRDSQWLDLLEDLGLATRLSTSPTVVDGVAFYGLDYATPHQRERAAVSFDPAPDARAAVLVGHGIVEGLPHGDWDLASLLEGAAVRFDAVLLGDHHEHVLERLDEAVVTYPGSTERVSADEDDPRGYNLVTVGGDGGVGVAHRSLPATRPFVYITVDLAPGEGESRVRDRLAEHDLDGAVVIVTLEGAGEGVTPAMVEQHAREAGALVVRVRDRRDETREEVTPGVEFADPDRAVRAALAEADVSQAAVEIDDVVRDLAIPDARVRERVRERIDDLLETAPTALERPASVEPPSTDVEDEGADPSPSDADEGDGPDGAARDETDDGFGSDDPDDGASPPRERTDPAVADAGQASMEDYL
ncbi:MAG: metallophosphoesterase [Halobacteriales archaeon]